MKHLTLALLLTLGCSAESKPAEPIRNEAPSVRTRWVAARGTENLALLEASARVLGAPNASAVVTAPAFARVLRVRVRPGEPVQLGQPLVDVLVPEVVHAAGALTSARLRLEAAEARRTRLGPLVEQGLAKSSELAELGAVIATTRAEAQAARASLRAAGISDQRASALLESDGSISLRSPLEGMVTAVHAQPGEVREPTSGALVEIAGTSDVQIEARLTNTLPSDGKFEWVSTTHRIQLVLTAQSPRAHAQDGSRLAWFDIAPGQPLPTPGSVGRVRTLPNVAWVVLPSSAISSKEGKTSVIALDGEKSAHVPVQVVMQSGSESVVVGVSKGTMIAADSTLAAENKP